MIETYRSFNRKLTIVSTCVDWTQGTGPPIRGTVRKEQVYCIQNMTVQLAKTVDLTCIGCALVRFRRCYLTFSINWSFHFFTYPSKISQVMSPFPTDTLKYLHGNRLYISSGKKRSKSL